jgi:hypothetical protein
MARVADSKAIATAQTVPLSLDKIQASLSDIFYPISFALYRKNGARD